MGTILVEWKLVWLLSPVDTGAARTTDASWGRWGVILDFIWGYDAVSFILSKQGRWWASYCFFSLAISKNASKLAGMEVIFKGDLDRE